MDYFYLFGSMIFQSSSGVCGSLYNRKNKEDASMLYTFIVCCTAVVVWLVMFLINPEYDSKMIIHAVIFGVCYYIANIGGILALKTGSIVITSLITQFSMIAVSVWAFIFWDTSITVLVIIGLCLVAVSLFLCLYNGTKENAKFNFKWLFYVILSFVGCAGCSISQKTGQMVSGGKAGDFFMFVSAIVSFILCLVTFIFSKKSYNKECVKKSWFLPVIVGLCNVFLNMFIIFLTNSSLSPSLIYPALGVGGLILLTLFSALIFKEKLKWWQWIGVAVGMISVVILSL